MEVLSVLRRVASISFIAVILAVVLIMGGVQAQESESVTLGVSPQLLELTANPGETLTSTFRLTNASADSIVIRTIPKNFTPRGEEGAVELTEEDTSFSLADWIDVSPNRATISPAKTADFEVTFNVPNNAEPGSHFGSVVFQTIPPEQEGSAALVAQEIAPVILVKIAGDIRETAEIEEFLTNRDFYSNQKTVQFTSRLKNTGTAHFKPTGQIIVKNMWGSEVARLDIDKKNALPDSIRSITTEWDKSGFHMGRYTAELTVVYGANDEIRTASTSFIIFPYQTVLPVVLIGIVAVFIVMRGRKRLMLAFRVLQGKSE